MMKFEAPTVKFLYVYKSTYAAQNFTTSLHNYSGYQKIFGNP